MLVLGQPHRSDGPQVGAPDTDALRRRLYLNIIAITMPGPTLVGLLNELGPQPDVITRVTNPLFTLFSLWCYAWLRGGRSLRTVEQASVLVCTAVVLLRALAIMGQSSAEAITSLEDMYWLLLIVTFFAFLTLGYRQAVVASALVYGLSVAVPWLLISQLPGTFTEGLRLGQVQVLCGVVLLMSWMLAWYREHYVLLQERHQITERLMGTDALTGLRNRHALYQMLGRMAGEGSQAAVDRRTSGPVALLVDVDHFKQINDSHGHNAGDDVLRALAGVLSKQLRECDVLGRWGGEEFLILLPELTPQAAVAVAERLRQSVAEHVFPGEVGRLTVSAGLAAFGPEDDVRAWLARADQALYQAKAWGRNQVVLAASPAPTGAAPCAG